MNKGGTDAILKVRPIAFMIGVLGLIVCVIGLQDLAAASLHLLSDGGSVLVRHSRRLAALAHDSFPDGR